MAAHEVKIEKINNEHLIGVLKSLDIEPSKDPEKNVEKLVEYYSKNKPAKIGECDICNGSSDGELDSCPFCGDVDPDAEKEPAKPKPKASDAEEEAPAPAKKGTKKSAKKSAKAAKGDSLAKPEPEMSSAVKYTEQDLDTSIKAIEELKSSIWRNGWKMGQLVREIRDKHLWKQRSDENGKPKYKSFEQFCPNELGFSDNQAYRMMDVSERFTEEQVRKFGTTKLSLVLEAPKEDQDRILEEKVAKNASSAEVREAVKKARAEKKVTTRETGRKKTPKGKAPPKKQAKPGSARKDNITVASIEGTKTVKLFKKESPEVRAKRIGDTPTGTLELTNDVMMHFTVIEDAEGALVIKVRTKREA